MKESYLEADHGPCPGDPVGEGDEGVVVHEADGVLGGGVELVGAVPLNANQSRCIAPR